MAFLIELTRLEWWVYLVVVFLFFFVALVLNYIVKKINEARLEERFIRLQNKASNNRSIQVQRQLENQTKPLKVLFDESNANTMAGISMVYNREENFKENQKVTETRNVKDLKILSANSQTKVESKKQHYKENPFKITSNDITKPGFLESVYKELSIVSNSIGKSKSLASADRDEILEKIVDKMVLKMKETKSAPSFNNLLYIQNEEELRKWALDLISMRNSEDNPTPSTLKDN